MKIAALHNRLGKTLYLWPQYCWGSVGIYDLNRVPFISHNCGT